MVRQDRINMKVPARTEEWTALGYKAAAFDPIEISPFEHLYGEGIYKIHRNRT